MVDKSKISFIIDAFMFLFMALIAGLGFLMKFVLIPGKDRWIRYGRNVELYWLGLDRHEWGAVHLIIGFAFLGLLVIHIILHWNMTVAMFRRIISRNGIRKIIATVFFIASLLFVSLSFLAVPEVQELARGEGHHRHAPGNINEKEVVIEKSERAGHQRSEESRHHVRSSIEVRGYMTLNEVAERYEIPIDYLKRKLNLPPSIPGGEKLGWLRRRYGFRMSDVETIIDEYQRTH